MNQLGLNTPMRDKYWREKTAAEKIETLADLLNEAHTVIRSLQERLDALSQHGHHPYTGAIMVPPGDQYGDRRWPRGYQREEFMLGRAPADHYGGVPVAAAGWAGEAQAEGSLPTVPHAPEPPVLAPAPAVEGADSVKSAGFIGSP